MTAITIMAAIIQWMCAAAATQQPHVYSSRQPQGHRSSTVPTPRMRNTGSGTRWQCASHPGPFGDLTLPADKCPFLKIFQFFRGKLKYVESAVLDWKLINKKGLDGKAEEVWSWEVSSSEGTEQLRKDTRGLVTHLPSEKQAQKENTHTHR